MLVMMMMMVLILIVVVMIVIVMEITMVQWMLLFVVMAITHSYFPSFPG